MDDSQSPPLVDDDAPEGLPEGTQFVGHFEILRPLGKGAQGAVYLAEDTVLHRKVALKVLLRGAAQSREMRARFQREAETTSRLEHPGICGVHEIGEVNGVPFIAMQFVKGKTLAKLIEDSKSANEKDRSLTASVALHGGSTLHDVLRVVEQAARALHAAHEAGLVHRDVKPANIMVTDEGEPVLLDFGLARDVDPEVAGLTQTGQIVGTPAYLAPEQIRTALHAIDRRTDVYALGVTLYECLTLRRPFEAKTMQELFHQILEEVPPDPRKVNTRIPWDLRTVIETAMEREVVRRYPTALQFAEDLRRVRSFEAIRAKPASVWIRGRKWVRRNPSKSVAMVSTSAFALAGCIYWVASDLARERDVKLQLHSASQALAGGKIDEAAEALARADARDPERARRLGVDALRARVDAARVAQAQELKKQNDLANAAAAREESVKSQEMYVESKARTMALQRAVNEKRAQSFSRYSSLETRAEFANHEFELAASEEESERLLQEAQEGLQRAARLEAPWGGMSKETEAAFASFYFRQWEQAAKERGMHRVKWLQSQVERFDRDGKFREELLGSGGLTLDVEPKTAELYLFRYESLETLRNAPVIPRLVPVPTTGTGRLPIEAPACGYFPGNVAWEVVSVVAGSVAEQHGLRPGDLIVGLTGSANQGALVVTGDVKDLTQHGIAPYAGVLAINGEPIHGSYDFARAPRSADGGTDRILFSNAGTPVPIDRQALKCEALDRLLESVVTEDLEVHALRRGSCVDVKIPRGSSLGIRCHRTAYPMVCSSANRIRAGTTIPMDPGSYVILAETAGHERQVVPFLVPRKETVRLAVRLARQGTVPPGYVFVPESQFIYQGDPLAFDPHPAVPRTTPSFFIAVKEVTNQEWFAFVNEPSSLKRIRDMRQRVYLPREPSKILAVEDGSGGYKWVRGDASTPVYGISWNDAKDFIAWKNRNAIENNEEWTYDLPSQEQWELAARGADGREFPWGSRFDYAFTVSVHHRNDFLLDEPGGFAACDESPFGVLDMGGSRREFTRDRVQGMDPPAYYTRGSFWGQGSEIAFRAASRAFANADYAGGDTGLRLVARRRN